MTITGIITAILIGIVVGVLGRLVLPGKQPIGMLVTILVGIVSAFVGTALARATRHTDCHRRRRLARTAGPGRRRGARCGTGLALMDAGAPASQWTAAALSLLRSHALADPAASPRRPDQPISCRRRRHVVTARRFRRMIARSFSSRPPISRSAPWLVGR